MTTKVFLINYQTGKQFFEYEYPPQYLPREGEYINIFLNKVLRVYKVLKVVHEVTYCNTINIYVTSSELKH